jgi:hypothetical protein
VPNATHPLNTSYHHLSYTYLWSVNEILIAGADDTVCPIAGAGSLRGTMDNTAIGSVPR